jgi:hypothetical protein
MTRRKEHTVMPDSAPVIPDFDVVIPAPGVVIPDLGVVLSAPGVVLSAHGVVIPDLYGCLPDSKKNLCCVVKKSAAYLYPALISWSVWLPRLARWP